VLLRAVLEKFTGCQVHVRGGDGCQDGGYVGPDGAHGHYWVEVDSQTDGRWVVDITADQFGGPPVLVLRSAEAPGYVAGDQNVVDEQVDMLLKECGL
jgi:hypothetical protein